MVSELAALALANYTGEPDPAMAEPAVLNDQGHTPDGAQATDSRSVSVTIGDNAQVTVVGSMGEDDVVAVAVEERLRKLALGPILFNPPQEMTVGIRERVEVRISKSITDELTTGLRGRGEPQIEEIKVGTFMAARLTGDGFDVAALSHEEQLVAAEGFTQWYWDAVPLKPGTRSLLLNVAIRIKLPSQDEERKDYPVFEKEIRVKVNLVYSTKNFLKSYWQWIVSTIIGSGVIGWIVKESIFS